MKKKTSVLLIFFVLLQINLYPQKNDEHHLTIMATRIYREGDKYIVQYPTSSGKTEYVVIDTGTPNAEAWIELVEKDDQGFALKAAVSPEGLEYSYKWEIIGPSGKKMRGIGRTQRFKQLPAGIYMVKLSVFNNENEVAKTELKTSIEPYVLSANVTQGGLSNDNELRYVTITSRINPTTSVSYSYKLDGDIIEETGASVTIQLPPGTAHNVQITGTLKNGKTVSCHRDFLVDGLATPSVYFTYQIDKFNIETNKYTIKFVSASTRNDRIDIKESQWHIDGSLEKTGAKIELDLKPGNYIIKMLCKDWEYEESIKLEPPTLNISVTEGECDEIGQYFQFTPSFFSSSIENIKLSGYSLQTSDGKRSLSINQNEHFSVGQHKIIAMYYNGSGDLVARKTETITVKELPLKATFSTTMTGKFKPSITNKWTGLFGGTGSTFILSPVTIRIPGNAKMNITITTNTAEAIISGHMVKSPYSSLIVKGVLSGPMQLTDGNILTGSVSGDLYLDLKGLEIEGKQVKITARKELVFIIVDGQLMDGNGNGDDDIVFTLEGEGIEFLGVISEYNEEHNKEHNKEKKFEDDKQANKPLKPEQGSSKNIVKPLNLDVTWGVSGMIEKISVNNRKEERLVIFYDSTHKITRAKIYFHKPSLVTLVPGQIKKILKEESKSKLAIKF